MSGVKLVKKKKSLHNKKKKKTKSPWVVFDGGMDHMATTG